MKAVNCTFCWLLLAGLHRYVDGSSSDENADGSINSPWVPDFNKISPDDIRCFCNLPQCVTTSYMCRTARSGSGSGCFSEISDPMGKIPTRHGCVELLKNIGERMPCDNTPRKHHAKATRDKGNGMLLLCCQDDMCNHVDSLENQKRKLDLKDREDLSSSPHFENINQLNVPMLPSPGLDNNDGWFRVATIAVPICGAVIFFILISVAIKILRSERISSPSSKLDSPNELVRKFPLDHEAQNIKQSPHPCRYSTNNHYASDLCDKKNETRAKINQLMNLEYSLLPQSCSDLGMKPNNNVLPGCSNLYRNVNISLDSSHNKNKDNLSKIYEKEVLSPVTANLSNSSNLKSYDI